jgi:protein TonB
MEYKKNPSIDLRRYHGLFLNIGLVISLGIVTLAFEWKTYDSGQMMDVKAVTDDFDEMLEIPITRQPPPPPPQKVVQILEIPDEEQIEEEIEIDLDIEISEETISEVIIEESAPAEEIDEVFTFVEQMPEPVVGYDAFYAYIVKTLKYPPSARRMGLEGKVFVQFLINKNGDLVDPKVIRGISDEIDQEAIRVIKNGPKWKPGRQRGRPVTVKVVIPLTFKQS